MSSPPRPERPRHHDPRLERNVRTTVQLPRASLEEFLAVDGPAFMDIQVTNNELVRLVVLPDTDWELPE